MDSPVGALIGAPTAKPLIELIEEFTDLVGGWITAANAGATVGLAPYAARVSTKSDSYHTMKHHIAQTVRGRSKAERRLPLFKQKGLGFRLVETAGRTYNMMLWDSSLLCNMRTCSGGRYDA